MTMRSVVSKRWPTRPFSLNLLGSEAGFLILREIERQRDRQAKPNKECFNLYLFLSAGNHRVSPFLSWRKFTCWARLVCFDGRSPRSEAAISSPAERIGSNRVARIASSFLSQGELVIGQAQDIGCESGLLGSFFARDRVLLHPVI